MHTHFVFGRAAAVKTAYFTERLKNIPTFILICPAGQKNRFRYCLLSRILILID
jgi:hypothetical protein